MLVKEYRIPLPLTVEEYRIGGDYWHTEISYRLGVGGDILQLEIGEGPKKTYGAFLT